ncbi:flagellar filament capping protein FliD [Pandoraea pulmonicola]|uniref:Flagellar hook-associated protein 2 n=1 Tax=Pandoraea pulmonicola TaxID=93221 RepID=A0AAJ4ZB52_PANPU|nr:flagellar filament capping protein FliD [Pandoraea pulmonicola]AJC21218.1 hypothetical protein RO07_13330 [Pandoraea pulmonicola]SUA90100.1 Flagellar cap protein [Pandoraea pulmonicola]
MLIVDDPRKTAKAFADDFFKRTESQLQSHKEKAKASSSALTTLKTSLSTFRTALSSMLVGGSMARRAVSLSDAKFGSATLGEGARAGSYNFYVKQVASANQKVIETIPATSPATGTMKIDLADGTSLDIDLSKIATATPGQVTPTELARAVNEAAGASGKLNASVMTMSDGSQKLMLTAAQTGEGSRITVKSAGLHEALKKALDGMKETTAAKDAVLRIGGQSGTEIKQASNTFTGVAGLSVTFKRVSSDANDVLTVNVSNDANATADGVQAFVDAYNAMRKAIGELTKPGDAAAGVAGGAMQADAGLRALSAQLSAVLRQPVDGINLYDLGIEVDKHGNLNLDRAKLDKTLAKNPEALDKFVGKSSTGMVAKLNKSLDAWLDSAKGQIKARRDSSDKVLKKLDAKHEELQRRYDQIFNGYVKQFTALQVVQNQMQDTLKFLENMFSPKKD